MQALESTHVQFKYQLVLAKVQAAARRLAQLVRNKEVVKRQRALYRLRRVGVSLKKGEVKRIVARLRKALKMVIAKRKCREEMALEKSLSRWRSAVARSKALGKVSKRLNNTEEKQKKELAGKDRTIAVLQRTLQQRKAEADSLRQSEGSLKQALELISKAPRKDTNEVQTEVSRLEEENEELREKIEAAEENVEEFIKEVAAILDSKELASNSVCSSRVQGKRLEERRQSDYSQRADCLQRP